MSFSPDILNKKLSSLQETQDSIVTISQWVLFHHRHCKETAELWATFILNLPANGSSKKLSLLYLCNDVVQQARHKRKMDFITEFSKVLPRVFNNVYKTLDPAIKPKVDRLVNVWSERLVFSSSDIKEMRKAIELSKTNKSMENNDNAGASGSSIFEGSKVAIASDLKLLNNVFLHMNQLIDISQGNLNQVGIQSKTYLPADPSVSDNLPSPKIYISKLNVLEKLCLMSNNNIEEIKKDRLEILKQLDNLRKIVSDGLQTDDSKVNIINKRLEKLKSTRSELHSIVDENTSVSQDQESEVPSPEFDQGDDDDDDMIPTYENEDSDEDDDRPPAKKAKHSPGSSGNSTPSSAKKQVAFSEDIEVKEYDREDQTENIKIIKSDDDENDDGLDNIYDDDDDKSSVSIDFERHHKDDLELKHEHDNNGTDDDGYDPSSQGEDTSESNSSSVNNSVLNLLAKLA